MVFVLGFCQSVGIEEDCGAWMDEGGLSFVVPIGHRSNGNIVVCREQPCPFADEQGCFVASIAVVQLSRSQVEHPDK